MREHPRTPPPPSRSLSVRIGRMVVRLALLGLLLWGAMSAYRAYQHQRRAREVAPIRAYALSMLIALKQGDYFAAQERLDPALYREVSIDYLAYFSDRAELNATRTGTWGEEWNTTREGNTTLYQLEGKLVYTNGHTRPMQWRILKGDASPLRILDLVIGRHALRPKKPTGL